MANQEYIVDGDMGFSGANDRLHPSQLPSGTVAHAENARFEFGDARVRWAVNGTVWGHTQKMGGNPITAARWFEPQTGDEALVVMTDGVRSGGDGGRGRAWKCWAGGAPIEIPMNGHDVWGAARLVAARTGLLLLRQGNARHYIPAANVNTGTGVLTLNAATDWVSGELVIVRGTPGEIPTPILADTGYYLKVLTSTTVELYTDAALSSKITFTGAGTLFAIERAAAQPGPGGLGANPLVLESRYNTATEVFDSAWVQGFRSVPQSVACTIDDGETVWLAQNHRLSNGQTVELAAAWTEAGGAITAGTDVYAHVIDAHHFSLHATAANALLGETAYEDASGTSTTTSVRPVGYSGQPMVPLREGIDYKNRLVGLNQRNNIAVSDPGDFLHFTPFTGAKTAAVGNGDPLTTLIALSDDTLLITSATQIQGITGLKGAESGWELVEITRQYGCIAPLSAAQVGEDVWLLSRRGIVSVKQTAFGKIQGVAVPVSQPISRKLSEVDWNYADQACAVWFNNKYICAVPLKGQTGTPVNNCLLVYNFLTQGWDHFWTGDEIRPVIFATLTIGRSERLCWLDQDGSVKYFDESGWEDIAVDYDAGEAEYTFTNNAISMTVRTRAYTGETPKEKRRKKCWVFAEPVLETIAASWGLNGLTEGYNESTTYRTAQTRDPLKFLTWNTADFYAYESDRVNLPYREDYSMVDTYGENILEGSSFTAGSSYIQPAVDLGSEYTVWIGNAAAVSTATTGGSPEAPSGTVLTESGTITPTGNFLYVWKSAAGPCHTVIRLTNGGLLLPDEGATTDTHQVYVREVHLRQRGRSIQMELTNAQGSARLRAMTVAGLTEKGDW